MAKGTIIVTPKEILFDGPRIMRDLMVLVRGSDARGVVLHLNNLENLSEADAKGAGEVLRSLRDIMLMHDGLHYIVVGTTDAINATVNQHVQVRSVFDTLMLEPMAVADVHRMLEERYAYLRVDPGRPIIPPVTADAVEQLYALFRGDLRGLLKALDDGVGQLIGLAGVEPNGGAAPVRPLTLDELSPVLQHRYSAQLATVGERGRVEQLTTWGRSDPASSQTQKSLQQLWGISQGSVSAAVTQLTALGYVVPLPRTSGQPMQYVLSGVSRLIFGSVPSEGTAAR